MEEGRKWAEKEKERKEGEGGGGEEDGEGEDGSSTSGARDFLENYNSLASTRFDHLEEDDPLGEGDNNNNNFFGNFENNIVGDCSKFLSRSESEEFVGEF